MSKQLRVLLIFALVCGVLLAAACGKTPSNGKTETVSAGEAAVSSGAESTSAAAEPVAADQTTASAEATEPAARELTAEIADRYLGIIDGLYRQYGEGHISDNGNWLTGLAFIKLMDLDGDGAEELICAYENPERGELFPYVNEYAVYGPDSDEPLFEPSPVCSFGNGDAPGLGFLSKNGHVYLEYFDCSFVTAYSHLENGVLVTDIRYEESEDYETGTVRAWLNGEEKDYETARAVLEGFEAAGQKEEIDFFDYEKTGALTKMLSDTNMTRYRLETLAGAGA